MLHCQIGTALVLAKLLVFKKYINKKKKAVGPSPVLVMIVKIASFYSSKYFILPDRFCVRTKAIHDSLFLKNVITIKAVVGSLLPE